MPIEIGQYTRIEFFDASFHSGSKFPCWCVRVLGTGYAPVDDPALVVLPPVVGDDLPF